MALGCDWRSNMKHGSIFALFSCAIALGGCGSLLDSEPSEAVEQESTQTVTCSRGQRFKLLQSYPGRFLALPEKAYLQNHYVDADVSMQRYAKAAQLYREAQAGDFIEPGFQAEFARLWRSSFLEVFGKFSDGQIRAREENEYLIGRSVAYLNLALAAEFNKQISTNTIDTARMFDDIFGEYVEDFSPYIRPVIEDQFDLREKDISSFRRRSTYYTDSSLVLSFAVEHEQYLWTHIAIQYLIDNPSYTKSSLSNIEKLNDQFSEIVYFETATDSEDRLIEGWFQGQFDTMRELYSSEYLATLKVTGICEYERVPLVAFGLAARQLTQGDWVPESEYETTIKQVIALHEEDR